MNNLTLKEIKEANLSRILSTISDCGEVSRLEISAKTGISLMTVGKAAEAMIRAGIAMEGKPAKDCSGRRAGILSFSDNSFFAVCDMSKSTFYMYLVTPSLKITDGIRYIAKNNFYFEENAAIFLENVRVYLQSKLPELPLGIGVILAPATQNNTDERLNPACSNYNPETIVKTAREALKYPDAVVLNSIELSCRAAFMLYPSTRGKGVYYIKAGDYTTGCFSYNGETIGRDPYSIASLKLNDGRLFGHVASAAGNVESLCALYRIFLPPICAAASPDVFIIDHDYLCLEKRHLTSILSAFGDGKPEIIIIDENINLAVLGSAIKLREIITARYL